MALLTVIVPFYDETAYIGSALNSIFSQGINDLQVIVVNDNPEVFSAQHLETLVAPHPVDLVHHPKNLGLSAARNSGLDRATGQFIAFLDSDDYYTSGGLADQLQMASNSGADITHAPTYFTRPGTNTPRILPRDNAFFMSPKVSNGLTNAQEAQFITSSWSSIYKRSFLDRNALAFDPGQPKFEDRLFVLHTVTRAQRLAFTGRPNRVWRGRAGSISVSETTPDIHLLQIQLLEKCMAHMQAMVFQGALAPRFLKRELFNTVSRLIWDLDVTDGILAKKDPIYAELAHRIPTLLGNDSFGQAIFDDPVIAPVNRVGMRTKKGRISRVAFFDIHRALRDGDYETARHIVQSCALDRPSPPKVRPSGKRLILHLGLHKTGSTFLQHHLDHYRDDLLRHGVLVPKTGFASRQSQSRIGATPGHNDLIKALRNNDPAPWALFNLEVRQARAETVVLTCENMGFPTNPDRKEWITKLIGRLRVFDDIDVVALARLPHEYIENFYREWVSHGAPAGAQGIETFLVDHAPSLTDFKSLFGPFEDLIGQKVRIADFDTLRRDGFWSGFCRFAGLPITLPELNLPRYPTPDRRSVQILQLLNALTNDPSRRAQILRDWSILHPAPLDQASLLAPDLRLDLINRWEDNSGEFASARGYTPELDAARSAIRNDIWHPLEQIPTKYLKDLVDLANQSMRPAPTPYTKRVQPQHDAPGMRVTIALRPWMVDLVNRYRKRYR